MLEEITWALIKLKNKIKNGILIYYWIEKYFKRMNIHEIASPIKRIWTKVISIIKISIVKWDKQFYLLN